MTLLFAMKTDKEVYLASDGRGRNIVAGMHKNREESKFIKVNEHVEILIAGNLEVARGYYTSAQHALWDKGLYERDCDACEIAKALEQEISPSFESIIKSFTTFIKSNYNLKGNDCVLKFLKGNDCVLKFLEDDWPLEIFVGGWDKDENGYFIDPVIYLLDNETHYKKRKTDTKDFVLGGAPDFLPEAGRYFKKFLLTDASKSPVEIGKSIDSGYKKIIHDIEHECAANCAIGEPIHIAVITKDGYELLRFKNEKLL
jgi:hypothetical protein